MVTYSSLFNCTPEDIINQKKYDTTKFTPYQYGTVSTSTVLPRYGTGTNEIYINVGKVAAKQLDSNTPFMILVTAKNQFGQLAYIEKVYTKTVRGSFAVEVTLKTTVLSSMDNVIKQVGNTLRISTSRILKLWDPSDDKTKQSTSMNVRPLLYRFVITEDPLNDDTTPSFTYGSQL
jgi:hypothetical protein